LIPLSELQHEADILTEIEQQTDRGAAILAVAFLDDGLLQAIKARLVPNVVVENRLFKGTAPLASFSAKIDLGHLLGLYTEERRRDFHRVREVRNEFAHRAKPVTFESQRIKDLIDNFRIDGLKIEITHDDPNTPKPTAEEDEERIEVTLAYLKNWARVKRGRGPRTKFLQMVQELVHLLILSRVENLGKAGRPASTPSLRIS
jgi:hypothetical protein